MPIVAPLLSKEALFFLALIVFAVVIAISVAPEPLLASILSILFVVITSTAWWIYIVKGVFIPAEFLRYILPDLLFALCICVKAYYVKHSLSSVKGHSAA